MSEKILEKILEKVENMETKVDNIEKTMATKEDTKKLTGRVNNIEKTMATKEDIKVIKEDIKVMQEDMRNLTGRVDNIEKTMATKEDLSRNTLEIAQEIRELAEMISRKSHQEHEIIKNQLELNSKDHKIFAAQIERLQMANEYIIGRKTEKLA